MKVSIAHVHSRTTLNVEYFERLHIQLYSHASVHVQKRSILWVLGFICVQCYLHSLRQILVFHLLLTAIYQTGIPSPNPRQSHRVHSVHATKKPHTPAGHRRPEEAERSAGATSTGTGESQGDHTAAGQLLLFRQQPVHQPQGQRCIGLRRWFRLELRV